MSDNRSLARPAYDPGDRTPDQIESEIAATRRRLSTTVDTLVYDLHPKTIARRVFSSLVSPFTDEDGRPDIRKIAPVAGGVVAAGAALVGLRLLVRTR